MSYLYINLLNDSSNGQLNPDEAIVRLQEQFPEAIVLPGDQLALSAQRAEQRLDRDDPAHQAVVRKLWADVHNAGPAYAFYISPKDESRIEGVIRRYQADFHSAFPISDALRDRIVAFLRSLVPEGAASEVCEEQDEEEEPALARQ